MLHVAGYDLTIADLKQFRQLGSLTPGHPELDQKYGIEVTTGPLGQGIANGVGLAIAERYLSYTYNKPDFDLFDNHTFVLCGDGDLQEGVALEAISLAGRLKLQKLVVLFDSNDIQLDKATKYAQNTDFKQFMTANHWDYFFVEDGNDEATLTATIAQAKASDQPAFIEVKTIIGLGATKQGTSSVHGAPLGKDIDHVYDYYD